MKAIMFGSLGTLADLSWVWRLAFRRALADHNLHCGEPVGVGLFPGEETAGPDTPSVEKLLASRDRHMLELLEESPISPHSGFLDLVKTAEERDVRLGLVETLQGHLVSRVLERTRIPAEIFDFIVTADAVVANKPAPDCYHLAAANLATAPEDCIALEDSRVGLRAAFDAGLQILDLRPRQEAAPVALMMLRERLLSHRSADNF